MNTFNYKTSSLNYKTSSLTEFIAKVEIDNQADYSTRLLALAGRFAASQTMLEFAAHLALRGAVKVLDGGNRFNAYTVARVLRSLGAEDLMQSLARIEVARAFTCYQMTAMLESTVSQKIPTLVIDLLDTFYDESAALDERIRLAKRSAEHLQRLSRQAPVVVSLRPPPPSQSDPTGLQEIIQEAADRFYFQEMLPETPVLKLF